MSDVRRETFEVGERPGLELNLPSGDAMFLPGEPGRVEVLVNGHLAEEFLVEQVGGKVLLRTPEGWRSRWNSFDVTVRVPPGADLEVRVASADVGVKVDLGSLNARLASGDLRARNIAGDATVQSASGDVEIGEVGGNLSANTASGDIRVRQVGGQATLNSASGEVRVGAALGALAGSTQSGDLDVGRFSGEALECRSVSGDVEIGLPPGLALDIDLNTVSGDIRSDFSTGPDGPPVGTPAGAQAVDDAGHTAPLSVKTVSGDIALVRAGR